MASWSRAGALKMGIFGFSVSAYGSLASSLRREAPAARFTVDFVGRGYNVGMSESAETVARAFVAAINRRDVEGLAALMTVGHRFVDSMGNVVEGRETMRAAWVGYFGMVPDYSVAVEECYGHPSDEDLSPGTPTVRAVVVMVGVAAGTYAPDGVLRAENRWETPAVVRAVMEGGLVAEWRVYADNEPMRRLMR